MGHRRLAVLDLSTAGRQPMASREGNVHIVYNGEVYNFKSLGKTLEKQGYRFRSSTDTEVVLNAYLAWEFDCLQKLTGMFSFVIWDGRKKRLFLARDRLGIKPLYYYFAGDTLLFASELKALMAFEGFKRDLDMEALSLYLHYQYIPAPKTIFKNTFKVLPGEYIAFEQGELRKVQYWSFPEGPMNNSTLEEGEEGAVAHLEELLTRAVSDRLISDVPLGALLSGGVDSSLVVALMQKVSTDPVKTFSIGFESSAYNEAPWASKIAKHLGTDHTELYVTPREILEIIPDLSDIYDEPFADASSLATSVVCRLARSHVTVALTGDGGDEQFAGYTRYWSSRDLWERLRRVPRWMRRLVGCSAAGIPFSWVTGVYPLLYHVLPEKLRVANFPDKWQKVVSMIEENSLPDMYRKAVCVWPAEELPALTGRPLPESRFERTFQDSRHDALLRRLMLVDQRTYLPDAMLVKVDRASMAVSLEARVPLLDHRVVEYTWSLPESLKFRKGTSKYLLKRLLQEYVPPRLFERPKMGFGVPIDRWFHRELKELLLDYLSPERLRREGLFNPMLVEKKIKEHLDQKANHQYRLWSLLVWEMWRERWID